MLQWVPTDPSVTITVEADWNIFVNGELVDTSTAHGPSLLPSKHAGPGQWLVLDVPKARTGDRVQVLATASEALQEGELACSLTVMNARQPLDRQTGSDNGLPTVECDAVIQAP